MSKRRTYSREFKIEAVRLVTDEGLPVKEVGRDLGVDPASIRLWKKQLTEEGERAFPGKGNAHDDEVRKLKRELDLVKMERDILKKAVGIFSQVPPR